jgi:hypothetical protein
MSEDKTCNDCYWFNLQDHPTYSLIEYCTKAKLELCDSFEDINPDTKDEFEDPYGLVELEFEMELLDK